MDCYFIADIHTVANCLFFILIVAIFIAPIKAWCPYDHPDRPGRPKICSDDREDHVKTLAGRLRLRLRLGRSQSSG